MTARVRPGDRVTLHYRIASYGQEIADTFPNAPESFSVGAGDIDARLEQNLIGLAEGERRTLELMPWQAFGERDEDLVQDLPRHEFPADAELEPERQVDFELPNGQVLTGTILAVEDAVVRIDFNHPLAGLPIEFDVQILAIEHA
ncbi:peptidylprolyl isomerase [Parasulfuritortus cantonensis]|uniref:Peptidyl-prolyl cis-trans isomerase n=1 Tax=Parasulfuritortus cantonensis TaxID=2528202 RepID=A0A4R1BE73_9PROT|nr:FKBP-type peptidyl-prolyl cis-trans isomerase [Parasulfuritortus cantonensis]TCJ15373.1 peptidylprolyl isomerase [Parasulfuritortus cantonensis]